MQYGPHDTKPDLAKDSSSRNIDVMTPGKVIDDKIPVCAAWYKMVQYQIE